MAKRDRKTPTSIRKWTDEDYKARSGWTIHLGPLLTADSLKTPEPTPQPKRGDER
jgi:hypothetical protein